MTGIYKIASPSGKVYIGQSVDIDRRWKRHKGDNNTNSLLNKSLSKYGPNNHSWNIIHELPNDVDRNILNKYEQLYMEALLIKGKDEQMSIG
jgi:group I intron endonuclease